MDTMSWVKKGAGPVVGIDFSPKAIEAARALSKELGIETEFVECDVYDAADRLQRTFDVVFSSYGVLCWLGDLRRWADNVARLVAPGGLFYLVEFHPFVWALADDAPPIAGDGLCLPASPGSRKLASAPITLIRRSRPRLTTRGITGSVPYDHRPSNAASCLSFCVRCRNARPRSSRC
jgi:SAM-dependent methyltransferase